MASVLLVVKVNNLFAYSRSQFQFLEESSPKKATPKVKDLDFLLALIKSQKKKKKQISKEIRNGIIAVG